MKLSRFFFCLIILAQTSFATPSISFSAMANQTVDVVWQQLQAHGLERWDAYHPLLPRPQVPAKYAVVNKARRVLAYFDEEYGVGGGIYVFKAPNGGSRHAVTYGWEGIKYTTPYAGNVAHANQYMTVSGPGYDFYCRSQHVSFNYFQNCVSYNWVSIIVRQLARFN